MKTLTELMERQWLVASWEGYAIFWNHSATFNVYAVDQNGRTENVWCETHYPDQGLPEADRIRWAIQTGREMAKEMRGQH